MMSSVDVHRASSLDTYDPRDPPPHLMRPQLSLPNDQQQQATADSSGNSSNSSGSGSKLRQKQRHSLKELNAMRRAAAASAAASSNNNNNSNGGVGEDLGCGASRVVKIRLPNGMVATDATANGGAGGCGGASGSTVDPLTLVGCASNAQQYPHLHQKQHPHHPHPHHPAPLSPNLLRVTEIEDDLSDWESPIDVDLANHPVPKAAHQSSWRKIRSFILWSPFIQVFKKHRYPWIQLAGHQGNFQAGDAGSVLKRMDKREQQCFHRLMTDSLRDYVPEYRGNVDKNGDTFIQLQDLLCTFTYPCVMDIKMGVRTYLEEELHKARKSPALRKDMYQKMMEVDVNAPTEEEHEQKAVTKPRYMQWRDDMSSSAEQGFRVEGIKQSDGKSSKDFKKTKERENIVEIIQSYVGSNEKIVEKYLERLREIRRAQESSEFFMSHEVVGSSLLFVHDADERVNIWMIDFGKTEPLPAGVSIDHRNPWVEGNREDGYLFGLDNLVTIFDEIYRNLSSTSV